jgi:hypothetical protein
MPALFRPVQLVSRVAGPVRLWCRKSSVDGGGLTFIARQNDCAEALKINPHHPSWLNGGRWADWATLDTLAVSRYCLRESALPVVQQPYGAATIGN